MFRNIGLLIGGLTSLWTVTLLAQDAVLGETYGNGVHAYFACDPLAAYENLTAAINGGSKDPRAFYFRGLAFLKLGRSPDAQLDFRTGAELETQDVGRFYNVGKALERVQGSARLELEKYRMAARMAAMEETERVRKARYESLRREESRVLRQPAADPQAAALAPERLTRPAADIDPFATPAEVAGSQGTAEASGKAPD